MRSTSIYITAPGSALCQELPPRQYQADAWARRYLSSSSDYVAIRGNETQQVTVALQPAAMAAFELSESLRKRVDTDSMEILCHITDLATGAGVPWVLGAYQSDEHGIVMSLRGPNTEPMSLLQLPQGRYRIDYKLRPLGTVGSISQLPTLSGTATVELTIGQTSTLVLDNR